MKTPFAAWGAIAALLGVAAGAFGAHALRGRITPEMIAVFETGARYQLVHALALIVVGLTLEQRASRGLRVAGTLFGAGIVLFSGSLYALALTGTRAWGAVTPLGGLCFLVGWALAAAAFTRGRASP